MVFVWTVSMVRGVSGLSVLRNKEKMRIMYIFSIFPIYSYISFYIFTLSDSPLSIYLSNSNNNWLQHPGNSVLGVVLPARLIWDLCVPSPL